MSNVTMLYFSSPTCGQCKLIAPIIEQITKDNPNITVQKVNAIEDEALAQKYSIRSLPSIVMLKDGVEVSKNFGAMPKAVIQKLINSTLEN